MCAESADQVQVDAVRPVPPTEFFRVGLADGPAAVRALKERLRHIQGRGLSPVRTLAPQRRPPCESSLRWWMEPPVERGEACRSACRRSPCRPGQCVPPIGGGGRGRRLGEPLAWRGVSDSGVSSVNRFLSEEAAVVGSRSGGLHLRGAEPLQPAPEHTGEHHAARIRSDPARRISGVAPGVARGEHSRRPWHT